MLLRQRFPAYNNTVLSEYTAPHFFDDAGLMSMMRVKDLRGKLDRKSQSDWVHQHDGVLDEVGILPRRERLNMALDMFAVVPRLHSANPQPQMVAHAIAAESTFVQSKTA